IPSRPASPSPSEISSGSEYVPRGDPEFQAFLDRNPIALMDYLVHKSIRISDQGPPIQQVYDYPRGSSQAFVEQFAPSLLPRATEKGEAPMPPFSLPPSISTNSQIVLPIPNTAVTSNIPPPTSERSSALAIMNAFAHPHIGVNSSMPSIVSQGQYLFMSQPPPNSQLAPTSRPLGGLSSNVPATVTFAHQLTSAPLIPNPAVEGPFQ
ncbi:hypothetical protein KI387_043320, partial [Taxus chinensis]